MSTQVAKVTPRDTIRTMVQGDQFLQAVKQSLPTAFKPERFVRVALTALNRNTALFDCTKESLFQCFLDLSALGLEPDGRRAHLIPFKNRSAGTTICTLIVDYKGLAELVRRSGEVAYLHADVVYEGDSFDYAFGSGAHLTHTYGTAKRGGEDFIMAYSFVKLKDGAEDFNVMTGQEVLDIRDNSQGYKAAIKYKNDHPWLNQAGEMGKKTVFRRHSKWLPLTPEIRDAIDRSEEAEGEESRFKAAKAVVPGGPDAASDFVDGLTAASAPASEPQGEQQTPPPASETLEAIKTNLRDIAMTQDAFLAECQAIKWVAPAIKSLSELSETELKNLLENFDPIISQKAQPKK